MIAPGGIIGNYVVERELGRGGMGVVYAATHRVLGRPAAIKVLLANTIEHRDRVERFFNEARAAMAIDHPGVVKIYDVGIASDGRAYIAMELLAGTPLAGYLARGPLPVRVALAYARQIAGALVAAHGAGIIHRDLKPGNIIVVDGGLKLVDFGIAKLAGPTGVRTATGALLGTPQYMSPEQCEGLRELDARTDLYSLGCVLFAMLSGRPPFDGGGPGGVITSHLTTPPPPLRSVCPTASPALEGIVHGLLAKSRDERFASARAVLAALTNPEVEVLLGPPGVAPTADAPGRVLSGAPTAGATGVAPAAPRPASRARAIVLGVLACVATAVIVVLVMRCDGSSHPPTRVAAIDAAAVQVAAADASVGAIDHADARPRVGATTRGDAAPGGRRRIDAAVARLAPPDAAVARLAPPDAEPPPVELDVTVTFAHQSFSFSGDPAVLDRVAAAMRADPRLRATIAGYAEDTEGGRSPDNLALARANAIKQQLVGRKVDRDRFRLTSQVEPAAADGSSRRARITTR